MSDIPRDSPVPEETNEIKLHLFNYYTSEVSELLSQDEDVLRSLPQVSEPGEKLDQLGKRKSISTDKQDDITSDSTSLCSNGVGAQLSDSKKERLKLLLKESVSALREEVDKIGDPIFNISRINSWLRHKTCTSSSSDLGNEVNPPPSTHKKHKVLSQSQLQDQENENLHLAGARNRLPQAAVERCTECHRTKTPQRRTGPDGTKSLRNACGLRLKKAQKRKLVSGADAEADNLDVPDDLKFIVEYGDRAVVLDLMKMHTDEYSGKIQHMEQKLDELLDSIMSSCRSMTLAEKNQLYESIQKLPDKNMDQVSEIIRRGKSSPSCEKHLGDDVYVDLDKQDNVTLWRLHYYVAAVENAMKKLCEYGQC